MRWLIPLLVGCGAQGATGTGTVVYSERVTGHVISLDLATGAMQVIDSGSFGGVAIAADRKYVAYTGLDWVVKVNDRHGAIKPLAPAGGGCGAVAVWGPNDSLTYCIDDQSGFGTVFLPAPGAAPRRVNGGNLAVSADGQHVVFRALARTDGTSTLGDDVVESADGAARLVLRSSVTDGGIFLFTPDQQHVLTPSAAGLLEIALADGSTTNLGSGAFAEPLPFDPGSNLSPDGTEILLFADNQYVGLNVATGQRRYIADAPAHCGVIAAFVDADSVVCETYEEVPTGGDTATIRETIVLARGSSATTLIPSDGTCDLVGVARAASYVAASCGNATIVSTDGRVLAAKPAMSVFGIADDESGIVAVDRDGPVYFLSRDGDARTLATAMSPFDSVHGDLLQPYVAYAP